MHHFYFILCIWVVLVHVFLYAMCMPGAREPEEGIRTTKTAVAGICEPPCGCLEPNSGPLKEQPARLAAEESFQFQCASFKKKGGD